MVEDNCEHFYELQRTGALDSKQQASALVWFFHSFYERLFDVHPSVIPLFKQDMATQGRKLVSMISLLISLVETDLETLQDKLTSLARMHAAIGVLSNQYATMMDVLIWSLAHCLGAKVFTKELRGAWQKCLSRVLQVLVPVHVQEELRMKRHK